MSTSSPLSSLILIATVVIATINLIVVNWGGDEVARMVVLPSDTVLVGQLQIEDQIGVPPCKQRLVHGVQQLEEAEAWSAYGVVDWSSVQLAVINEVRVCLFAPLVFLILNIARRCQNSPNLFSPFELDPYHHSAGIKGVAMRWPEWWC